MTETSNLYGLKSHIPSFSWSLCGLFSGQPPLQNPTPGVPVAEGGNVIRRLTGAMVCPSQVEALCLRLHGMGGDSRAGYNPAYDTCAVGFAHSECEPYALFAPYTACTVHTGCIPHADCDPLHLCVLYPVCAVYAAHATHLACVPYAACYTYSSCNRYAACALYTFFQIILMI